MEKKLCFKRQKIPILAKKGTKKRTKRRSRQPKKALSREPAIQEVHNKNTK